MENEQVNERATPFQPGQIVLFGSGETSYSGRKIFEKVLYSLPKQPKIAILETPAGFELNSREVATRISDFLVHSLQNYQPRIEILPARKRGTDYSPDDPEIVSPILESDLIFMGPGSPTYAVRQLKDSLGWDYTLARHLLGASLVLASSAVVAVGSYALPVYEIFKVGEDLHWKEGLDLFTGMNIVFVPHWNNQDGGSELDTSCCFVGKMRFAELLDMLPPDVTTIGIDEQTALFSDFDRSECRVLGKGTITVIQSGKKNGGIGNISGQLGEVIQKRGNRVSIYEQQAVIAMERILPADYPKTPIELPASIWLKALAASRRVEQSREKLSFTGPLFTDAEDLPGEIISLLDQRAQAREQKQWQISDKIREELRIMGWDVLDTPEGQKLSKRV